MTTKLVGFGELLLRLDAPGHERLTQAEQLKTRYTGGEANVCVAAKRFGVDECMIVSRVPDHAIGDACLEHLQKFGIDTSMVARGGDRLGILFVENGQSLRPTSVIYDRLHSSMRTAAPQEFDWPAILQNAGTLHISGTAPALGPEMNEILTEAISSARELGVPVSFDCSYRSSLWETDEAAAAYRRLAPHVDVLFAAPSDATTFFGFPHGTEEELMRNLAETFNIGCLAWTIRNRNSASSHGLEGRLLVNGQVVSSRAWQFSIVDRIGSGDAFAAGILTGRLLNWGLDETVEFATAAAVLKHSIPGDFCLVSPDEVRRLVRDSNLSIRR